MTKLELFCKTYRADIDRYLRLETSIYQHNVDNIPLVLSVPKKDIVIFKDKINTKTKLISDESYAKSYMANEPHFGLPAGYVNQEICKLSYWETSKAQNYLCLDADTYFIKDFHIHDFIHKDGRPYQVLVEDKDLNANPYYREYGEQRKKLISRVFDEVGLSTDVIRTCHNTTVFNKEVLKDFKSNFLTVRKYGYLDLIDISPFEFSWYNAWLQKSNIIEYIPIEPHIKMYHFRLQYLIDKVMGVTTDDIKSQYLGIILNSNWKPKPAPMQYGRVGWPFKVLNSIITKL